MDSLQFEFDKKGKQEIALQPTVEIGNENYIPFYQMKIVAGRNMLHSDSANELVINETLAKAMGFPKSSAAIGKMLYTGDKPYPIVGVVADFHQGSFHDAILPALIQNAPDDQKRINKINPHTTASTSISSGAMHIAT